MNDLRVGQAERLPSDASSLCVALTVPAEVLDPRVPSSSVCFDDQADVGIRGVDEAIDGASAGQRELPARFRKPACPQSTEEPPFELARWRDVSITPHIQECDELRDPRLAWPEDLAEAGVDLAEAGALGVQCRIEGALQLFRTECCRHLDDSTCRAAHRQA